MVAKALGSALPASSSRKNAAAWRAIQKIAVVTTIAKARSPQSPAPRSSQLRPTSRNSDTTKSPIASAQRAATLLRCVPEKGARTRSTNRSHPEVGCSLTRQRYTAA